jgi:hypothetical protein
MLFSSAEFRDYALKVCMVATVNPGNEFNERGKVAISR